MKKATFLLLYTKNKQQDFRWRLKTQNFYFFDKSQSVQKNICDFSCFLKKSIIFVKKIKNMNLNIKNRIFIALFIISISISGFSQESKLKHFEFYSKSLGEIRKLTIYIPENFNSNNSYNVVFCTDGQLINEQYKNKLDSLFKTDIVSPLVIIGINSNEKTITNSIFEYRNFEYIENQSSDDSDLNTRFKRHLNFFVKEIDEYIEKELNLKINNKYFYGVSNGADFGVSLSIYYPDLFSKYILYSMAGQNYKNLKWNSNKYPFFIIRCGNEEPEPFINASKNLSKYLAKKHYTHIFDIYNGGHNREKWMNLFIKDLEKLENNNTKF